MALAVAADMWLAHNQLFGSEARALCDIRDWTCHRLARQPNPYLSTEQRTLRPSLALHLDQVTIISCSAKCSAVVAVQVQQPCLCQRSRSGSAAGSRAVVACRLGSRSAFPCRR